MKRFFAILMMLLICTLSVFSVSAAGELTINNEAKAKKGNKVTYELNLGDCDEKILGLQMYISYDNEKLEVVKDSLVFPEIDGVVSNCGAEYIVFNWTNVSNLLDFSAKKVLAKVDFKVLKEGDTSIEYFVEEMYGMDMTYLKSYTFTYNLLVNDDTEIKEEVPPVIKDEDFVNNAQGGFINYVDGKGEENGSKQNKPDDKSTSSNKNTEKESNKSTENKNSENKSTESQNDDKKTNDETKRETVMGTTQAPTKEIVDETLEPGEVETGIFKDGIPQSWLIGGAVVLLVIIIVVLVIVNSVVKKKKAKTSSTEEKED